MHELLLFGQVPSSRHAQVLKVLAGIAAMQPQPITEQHLIFKPIRTPGSIAPRAGPKPGQAATLPMQLNNDLFYVQLVGHMHETPSQLPAPSEDAISPPLDEQPKVQNSSESNDTSTPVIDLNLHPWSLEFRDLPEVPGRRSATSRLISSTSFKSGNPLAWVSAFGYTYTGAYLLDGHQLVHENIILQLYRLYPLPSNTSPDGKHPVPNPLKEIPDLATLKALDTSGSYVLQASLRVQDGSKVEIMNSGMEELKAFKETMKGVVEMEMGDRLALDTRVR